MPATITTTSRTIISNNGNMRFSIAYNVMCLPPSRPSCWPRGQRAAADRGAKALPSAQPGTMRSLLRTFFDAAEIHRDGEDRARLRAFPTQAVLGPCFSTGAQSSLLNHPLSFSSVSAANGGEHGRKWQRGDALFTRRKRRACTACGGKSRKRPSQFSPVNACATTRTMPSWSHTNWTRVFFSNPEGVE